MVRKRRQNKLHLKAEEIQCVRPLRGIKRSESVPTTLFVIHQGFFELFHYLWVSLPLRVQFTASIKTCLLHCQFCLSRHIRNERSICFGSRLVKKVIEFNHMAVDVNNGSVSGIGHYKIPPNFRPAGLPDL